MKVVTQADAGREAWNRCVHSSDEAWLFHDWDWVELEGRFFAARNLSFALYDKDEIMGVCPLYLAGEAQGINGETIVHAGVHRHAAPALRNRLAPSLAKTARTIAIKQILETADAFDVDRIHLGLQTAAPAYRTSQKSELTYLAKDFGFQLGLSFAPWGMSPCPGLSTLAADQIVPLDADDDALFQRLNGACRQAIRRAEKSKLTWTIGNVSDSLDAYLDLARRSSQRTGEVLPPEDYYRAIGQSFDAQKRACIAFSLLDGEPAAGLILLIEKSVMSFLAGVSDPDALSTRCNDHVHWQAILWAKHNNLAAYRLGPFFPEVPRDWPIARVSAFKTKFGCEHVPICYASKFRKPEKYIARLAGRTDQLAHIARHTPSIETSHQSLSVDIVAHHLRLLGVRCGPKEGPLVIEGKSLTDVACARRAMETGRPVIALLPSQDFLDPFDVKLAPAGNQPPNAFRATSGSRKVWSRVRTLDKAVSFSTQEESGLTPIVVDENGEAVWAWLAVGKSGLILVGTDLAGDLVRYRQGDPTAAQRDCDKNKWGFSGERPNYLFEPQLAGEKPHERHADWWAFALRDALVRHAGLKAGPILPNQARGVIVVTGDDDGAQPEHYEQQCALLDPVPVTYFTLPEPSSLDADFMHALSERHATEWELHPDAWDAPEKYSERFDRQSSWFKDLSGRKARFVRNHGFLNDGYWGHLPVWRKHGIVGSSNLPGFDGQVLNGSLLPARLAINGELTEHWSLLTLIGDGVVFANGWTDAQAAGIVRKEGRRILDSGVPGVMCLNLHPVNIEKTKAMHEAVRELAGEGFVAMTFSDLLSWFEAKDSGEFAEMSFVAERIVRRQSAPLPTRRQQPLGQSTQSNNPFARLFASIRK